MKITFEYMGYLCYQTSERDKPVIYSCPKLNLYDYKTDAALRRAIRVTVKRINKGDK